MAITSITLAWDPPASTGSSPVVGYLIYGPTGTIDTAILTATFDGLTAGTTYSFSASCYNSSVTSSFVYVSAWTDPTPPPAALPVIDELYIEGTAPV